MGVLGKIIGSVVLVSAVSGGVMAQPDSLQLVASITNAETLIRSNYHSALNEARVIYEKTLNSPCVWCQARTELMIGKMYWSDGEYPVGLQHFRRSAKLSYELRDYNLWATAIDLIATTYYYQAYYDSAKVYYQQSYDQYEKLNDYGGMVKVLNNFCLMYHRQGNFQKSIEYLFRCEKVRKDHPGVKYEIEALGAMGSLMVDTLYYHEQVAENLKELALLRDGDDDQKCSGILHNLGKSYRQLEEYRTAARYFVKAAKVHERMGVIPVWAQAGIDYRDADMLDSSLFYLKLARDQSHRTPRPFTAYHLELTGDTFKYFEKFDSALVYYKRAFDLGVAMNNRITFTGIHRSLVDVYTGLKRYKEAEYHLKTGIQLANEVALIHKRNLYGSGRKLYEQQGNYAVALTYATMLSRITDSLNRQQTALNLTRLQAEYQTAKKEQELEAVKSKNIEHELSRRNAEVMMASLAGVTIISVGFLLVFARQRNNIRKKNAALDIAYHEQLTLLQEIHHRVKNNLQLIASLINLQSTHSGNPDVVRELEKTRSRIMSIALIHQNLYQHDNIGPVNLKNFLEDLIANVLSSASTDVKLTRDIDIAPVNVGIENAMSIGLIVNELLTNSLKHGLPNAAQPSLSMQLAHQRDNLVIIIKDNGPGIDPQKALDVTGGFGLRLVAILLKRLAGKIETFENGRVTKVSIGKF